MRLRKANVPIPGLVLGKHAAKHATVAAIHLPGTFAHILLHEGARVEGLFPLVQRFIPEVLLQCVEDRIVGRAHRVVVPNRLVPQIDYGHAPVHSTDVNRHRDDVVREDVHLARPPFQAGMARREQLRDEERIHGVHPGKTVVGALLATLHQQVHVEVDDLVVQPVVSDQRGQIVASNADVELVDDDLRE